MKNKDESKKFLVVIIIVGLILSVPLVVQIYEAAKEEDHPTVAEYHQAVTELQVLLRKEIANKKSKSLEKSSNLEKNTK
ncbi:MAG: hypothetical protein ACK4NC_00740 [Candidatus Gracilibacteria bacterium]